MKKTDYPSPSFIGHTPLVPIRHILDCGDRIEVHAKLELCSVGGSMKDRAAFNMIRHSLLEKSIRPGDTVIESSSGNMAIGLALACRYYGLRFLCVVDERTGNHTTDMLEALAVEVRRVTDDDLLEGESLLDGRLRILKQVVETRQNVYWTNQYANRSAAEAYELMMQEINTSLGKEPDYIICATGTCGTIRGCSDYILRTGSSTKILAVDAVGSVIFGARPEPRLLPGHGSSIRPDLFREGMCEQVIYVKENDAVVGCNKLLDKEAIFAGASSGAIISALEQVAPSIPKGATVVLILPDRGERYLTSVYNKKWVDEHIMNVI